MKDLDLRDYLNEWPYDPDKTVRVVETLSGRSVLQVRLPLGIEQYELDGRPDGSGADGYPTWVDAVEARAQSLELLHKLDEFQIDPETFSQLQGEGIMYYYRYLLLFQINDFPRVVRDTEHNLRLCRLLKQYCKDEPLRTSVLQFEPYIIRMKAMAESMQHIQKSQYHAAAEVLEAALVAIEELPTQASAVFQFERSRSMTYLRTTLEQISNRDEDPASSLEAELASALEEENYERAAEIRDRMRQMR